MHASPSHSNWKAGCLLPVTNRDLVSTWKSESLGILTKTWMQWRAWCPRRARPVTLTDDTASSPPAPMCIGICFGLITPHASQQFLFGVTGSKSIRGSPASCSSANSSDKVVLGSVFKDPIKMALVSGEKKKRCWWTLIYPLMCTALVLLASLYQLLRVLSSSWT